MTKKNLFRQIGDEVNIFLEKGITSFILVLLALFCLFILIPTTTDVVLDAQISGISNVNLWSSIKRVLLLFFSIGTGSGNTGVGSQPLHYLVAAGRVLLFGVTVSFFTVWLNQNLQPIHAGQTRINESGHTIILGWSRQIIPIIRELIEANSNQKKSCIVILAPVDPQKMKKVIRNEVGKTGKTKLVLRQGEQTDIDCLALVSLNTSKSIIVLGGDLENLDRIVLETIQTLVHYPDRKKEPFHIVAALREQKNIDLAKFHGKNEVELVAMDDINYRLLTQVCCQPVMRNIYADLMDFHGQEIYFTKQAELIGRTYQEALFHFDTNAVIGLYCLESGGVVNPPMDRVITASDYLALLAADDDQIVFNDQIPELDATPPIRQPREILTGRNLIILGWNRQVLLMLNELNKYLPAGSQVLLVQDDVNIVNQITNRMHRWHNLSCSICKKPSEFFSDSRTIAMTGFNEIILLVDNGFSINQVHDLQALKNLQWMCEKAEKDGSRLTVTSGVKRLVDLLEVSPDLVNSIDVDETFISSLICQIAENKGVNSIFADLFNTEGSELYVKPITNYIAPDSTTDFYTLLGVASSIGETAIGYIHTDAANPSDGSPELRLNPAKHLNVEWQATDQIITLADSAT